MKKKNRSFNAKGHRRINKGELSVLSSLHQSPRDCVLSVLRAMRAVLIGQHWAEATATSLSFLAFQDGTAASPLGKRVLRRRRCRG